LDFRFEEFCELRVDGVLGSSHIPDLLASKLYLCGMYVRILMPIRSRSAATEDPRRREETMQGPDNAADLQDALQYRDNTEAAFDQVAASLERVMDLGENRIEMRISRSAWFLRDLRFPHS
jgi:hypothetical protein